MQEPDFPVDFVVSWVNGADKSWLKKKNKYMNTSAVAKNEPFNSDARYREYGLFKFWFRAVEKNAPWVRNIYLVTDSQIPDFLDTKNSKITIVDHKDIIDHKYLPTFDSSTIELNIHHITGLTEHFVYLNDDFYINYPVKKSDFFTVDGFARDTIGQSILMPTEEYDHNLVNNIMKVNQIVQKKNILKNQWQIFFDLRQGLKVFSLNLFLSIFPRFTRLYDPHTAYSLIKSDMQKGCELLSNDLHEAFSTPFRSLNDYTIQFIRYFQIINNHERPRNVHFGNTANSDNVKRVEYLLFKDKRTKLLNVNDVLNATQSDLKIINHLFEIKFANKSKFER